MVMQDRYPDPSGADVARFLGRADDEALAQLAGMHVAQIATMARAYTRGSGFLMTIENDVVTARPNDEIAAVVLLATARLVTNPAQVNSEEADDYRTSGSFQGWTLPERAVLDRYRRRAG